MRRCSCCKLLLDEGSFNWITRGIKLSYNCKNCSREYVRKHYENNKQYYLDKAKRSRDKNRQACFSYLRAYLKCHPCVDCGEKDILVLEFDHRDRVSKDDCIGDLLMSNATVRKLGEEVLKCEVRCANCHRRKTQKEMGSWRLK